MPLTAQAQNTILDALFRGAPLAVPGTYYVALVTTMGATNSLAGVEVAGGAYARVPIACTLAAWAGTQGDGSTQISIGDSATSSNNAPLTYPIPTANWGSVVGYELWDDFRAGFRWFYDVLLVPKTVSLGDPAPVFPAGTLRLRFI
jgi:hypothetical protein